MNICRAAIVGFACLALAGASRAGEGARNIELVPLHGTAMDTNFDQSSEADSQTFKAWAPQAPHSLQPTVRPGQAMAAPSRPQNTPSAERERELNDRRRNWVFMTPEDYASPDGKKDGQEENGMDRKLTVMERFYQHLYDSDHSAMTNQFGNNPDRLGGRTNLMGGDLRSPDGRAFADSPFNAASSNPGIFQSVRRVDSSSPFGSDLGSALQTPEDVRLQAEQKAHMESYRQIWNIDQPSTTPVVSAPASAAPVDSGPLFGLGTPTVPAANFAGSFEGGFSTRPPTPPPTVTSSRNNSKPPHADFTPPQRPF